MQITILMKFISEIFEKTHKCKTLKLWKSHANYILILMKVLSVMKIAFSAKVLSFKFWVSSNEEKRFRTFLSGRREETKVHWGF